MSATYALIYECFKNFQGRGSPKSIKSIMLKLLKNDPKAMLRVREVYALAYGTEDTIEPGWRSILTNIFNEKKAFAIGVLHNTRLIGRLTEYLNRMADLSLEEKIRHLDEIEPLSKKEYEKAVERIVSVKVYSHEQDGIVERFRPDVRYLLSRKTSHEPYGDYYGGVNISDVYTLEEKDTTYSLIVFGKRKVREDKPAVLVDSMTKFVNALKSKTKGKDAIVVKTIDGKITDIDENDRFLLKM